MYQPIIILSVALLLASCQPQKDVSITNQGIELNGSWEYEGFGKGIVINDTIVKNYHLSSVGNVSLSDYSRDDYFDYHTLEVVAADTILLKDGVKTFKLYRSFLDFESGVNQELAKDPQYNFEVLWNTFNEHYCYFKERKIDWAQAYQKYKPQINENTSPLELYLIFEEMLGAIGDSHISMDVPDELEELYAARDTKGVDTPQEEDTGELEKKVKKSIVEKYLSHTNYFNKGEFKWGRINKDIGYLQISNMVSMAHYPIPDSLARNEFWDQWWEHLNNADNHHDDVREGTRFMMDSILRSIEGVKACIIDLRFNGGGFDDASVEILNHFVTRSREFATKKVRLGNGFTEKQTMSMNPSGEIFKGSLYILTSHLTASAAEVLVLGSREIPNSTIIGSSTEGVFSDILKKRLPNRWSYGLSNMVYQSMEGISYENVGIKPDFVLPYPLESKGFYAYLLEEIEDGDDAIELVISQVKKNQ